MEEMIQHSSHERSLVFCKVKDDNGDYCDACHEPLSAFPIYACRKCRFFLHESSGEPPQELHHFYHPCLLVLLNQNFKCQACETSFEQSLAYHCELCNFYLDTKCALLPFKKPASQDNIIHHFSHAHPLTLFANREAECSACGEPCVGPGFLCRICKLFVHKSCLLNLPPQLHYFYHPCPLILLTASISDCRSCRTFRTKKTLIFRCVKCKFDLDVKCALALTKSIDTNTQIQHSSHLHPLTLSENNFTETIQCKACRQECLGPIYACHECKFYLDKSCATLPQEIQHPFHPHHPLTFRANLPEPSACKGCGLYDQSFRYFCERCSFSLDFNCVLMTPSFEYKRHDHLLTFFDQTYFCYRCSICHEWDKGSLFRCVECDLNLHFHCHPSVRHTFHHKCHPDPLNFIKYLPQDGSNELYCDVCEERRNPLAPVYYCDECDFVSHLRCVLPEVLCPNAENGSDLAETNVSASETNLVKIEERINKVQVTKERMKEVKTASETERSCSAKVDEKPQKMLEPLKEESEELAAKFALLTAKIVAVKAKIEGLEEERALRVRNEYPIDQS